MTDKKLAKIMGGILGNPESKIAVLNKVYDLIFEGERNIMAESYVIVTPSGVAAKVDGVLWEPEGHRLCVPG